MTFPIYRVSLIHSDVDKTKIFHNKMFRSEEQAESYFKENEKIYRAQIKGNEDLDEFLFEYTLSYRETWCMEWFSHYTFRDRFTSPGSVLADFEQYVNRVERRQGSQHLSPEVIEDFEERSGHKWICLMGAEDRFRWSGAEDGPAPCSCKHCIDQGVWRINH